jgi:hypothetical protein
MTHCCRAGKLETPLACNFIPVHPVFSVNGRSALSWSNIKNPKIASGVWKKTLECSKRHSLRLGTRSRTISGLTGAMFFKPQKGGTHAVEVPLA